jgi:hypothetical protein
MKMAKDNKVKFVLKGKKREASFSSPETAEAFIKAAAEKWGPDFSAPGSVAVTSDKSYIDGMKPEGLKTADDDHARDVCICGCNRDGHDEKGRCDKCGEKCAGYEPKGGKKGKEAGFNFFFPGQALREFYPDLQHELVDYPNATNAPMTDSGVDVAKGTNESTMGGIVGDPHEDPELDIAIEASFDGMKKLGYVSTSPGAVGLGRDFKPQVLEGKPFRKEDEIRGPMFQEEFYQNFDMGPEGGALNVVAKRAAAFGGEKAQFGAFLKKVMAEVAATFISAWKVTSRPPLDKVPGTGSLQLDQVEQRDFSGMSGLLMGQEGMGSRVKHLVDKLNDSDVQDEINNAWAQSAVWNSTPNGGFVYEVFVRAESLDSESLLLKYKFVTGVRGVE